MTTTLPQLDRLFLTDAGLETDLIFNRGVELRCFAVDHLARDRQTAGPSSSAISASSSSLRAKPAPA